MKKSVTIRIPEPCHEDWNKMTTTEKGKFCQVCTKEVVDLTNKSDEQLYKLLANSQNTCGRVKKSQLNREIILPRKSGMNFAPYAASIMIPFTLLGTTDARSSDTKKVEKTLSSLGIGKFSNTDRIRIITTGKITDEYGKPITNVNITVKGTRTNEFTGNRGNYRIVSLDGETLVFSKKGYITKEVKLANTSKEIDISLTSEVMQSMILGEVEIPMLETKMAVCEVSEGNNTEEDVVKKMKDSIPTKQKTIKKDSTISKISGVVTDDTLLPLPGVNVIIKGTATGTQTDFDGNYKIDVMPGQQLVFSYVGFETKEVTIANIANTIDINMTLSEALGGLIVVGGISPYDYESGPSIKPFGQQTFNEDPEREAIREKQRLAYKNEIEFKRIKQARKKAQRQLRRAKAKK